MNFQEIHKGLQAGLVIPCPICEGDGLVFKVEEKYQSYLPCGLCNSTGVIRIEHKVKKSKKKTKEI